MKLFIIASLIAVSAAGRLEHLERSYLPPSSSNQGSYGSAGSSYGNGASGFGSVGSNSGSHGSSGFGSSGFGTAGSSRSGPSAYNSGSFAGATSNQYLPPNYGSSSGSNGFGKSSSSLQGFGSQQGLSQQYLTPQNQYSSSQQYTVPATQYGTPQLSSSSYTQSGGFGAQARYQSQSQASRQYLAPKASSFQNTPQQSFDEETGYHY